MDRVIKSLEPDTKLNKEQPLFLDSFTMNNRGHLCLGSRTCGGLRLRLRALGLRLWLRIRTRTPRWTRAVVGNMRLSRVVRIRRVLRPLVEMATDKQSDHDGARDTHHGTGHGEGYADRAALGAAATAAAVVRRRRCSDHYVINHEGLVAHSRVDCGSLRQPRRVAGFLRVGERFVDSSKIETSVFSNLKVDNQAVRCDDQARDGHRALRHAH